MISFSRGARWPARYDQPFRTYPGRGRAQVLGRGEDVNFFFSRPLARAEPKVLRGAARRPPRRFARYASLTAGAGAWRRRCAKNNISKPTPLSALSLSAQHAPAARTGKKRKQKARMSNAADAYGATFAAGRPPPSIMFAIRTEPPSDGKTLATHRRPAERVRAASAAMSPAAASEWRKEAPEGGCRGCRV